MGHCLLALRCVCICASVSGAAVAQEVNLPNDIPPHRPRVELRAPVSVAQRDPLPLAGRGFGGRGDASLAPATYQIFLDADELLAVGQVDPQSELAVTSPVITFSLGASDLAMLLAERSYDRHFDVYHLTLIGAASDDRGYLTVSQSYSEIVGTFTIADSEFRVISLNGQSQLVYRVSAEFEGFQRASLPDMNYRLGRLEARHLQLGYLASIGSRAVLTYPDGHLIRASGIDVGDIDVARARTSGESERPVRFDEEILAAEAEEFFESHRIMTLHAGEVELDVWYIRRDRDATEVFFRQVIDGIPLEGDTRLTISDQGKVKRVLGGLTRRKPVSSDRSSWLTLEQAVPLAAAEVAREFGSNGPARTAGEELLFVADSPDDTLVPYWRFELYIDRLPSDPPSSEHALVARVNALTGAASASPQGIQ